MTHYTIEIRKRCFHQQMVVIAHQTIRMNSRIISLMGLFQTSEKRLVVNITMEYPASSSTTIHHVIIRILILDSYFYITTSSKTLTQLGNTLLVLYITHLTPIQDP